MQLTIECREEKKVNIYVVFGVLGIIGNFVAALADVPLVRPGRAGANDRVSLDGINSWWADVPAKRFKVSFWLSFLGQPGAYITLWLLADLIAKESASLAIALRINTFIGCYTGLLCHLYFCLKPLLYQKLCKKVSDEESIEIMKAIDPVSKVPMLIGGVALWFGGTILVAIAIITGALAVSKWCLLLNPIGALVVVMILKKCRARVIGGLGAGYMLMSLLLIIAGI